MARLSAPLQQFLDANCNRLANGSLQFYENGTTTPKAIFQDVDFQIPQSNPLDLSACGETPALLQLDGVYTVEVRDSTGAVVNTINDVTGIGGGTSTGTIAADIGYTAPFTGAVQQTVKSRLGKRVYISDFAITPQPTGQRLEIQTVIDTLAALNAEYTLVFGDPGEYNIDLTTTDTSAAGAAVGLIMPSNIHLELRRGSNLRVLANNSDSYALILYPSTTTNSFVFGGGQLIGDISDHTTGTGDDGNLLWFAGCTNCGAIGIEANEAWGNSAYISEDDATNDRASEILLQDFVSRSNRNNGILIDNSDTVEIINYRAFSIGQGASQSGTSDGVNISLTADTTRMGNINVRGATIDGAFGSGIKIDVTGAQVATDYGENIINFYDCFTSDTFYGVNAISYDQFGAGLPFIEGSVYFYSLTVTRTLFASINMIGYADNISDNYEWQLFLYNVNLRDAWRGSLPDTASSFILSSTASGGASFVGLLINGFVTQNTGEIGTTDRPQAMIRFEGGTSVGSRIKVNAIMRREAQDFLTTDGITTANIFPQVWDPYNVSDIGNAEAYLYIPLGSLNPRFDLTRTTSTVQEIVDFRKGSTVGSAADTFLQFTRTGGGTEVAFINMDAAGNLSFSTSVSDRRLKLDYTKITGALERLARVPVYSGKMRMPSDTNKVLDWQYHIADEMAAEFPELVEGTQDAVDDDGNPIYQRIKQDKTLQLWAALGDAHSLLDSQGKAILELESRLRRMEDL